MSNLKAGPKPIATFAVLVALVMALIAIAVPAAAGAASPTACKNRTNTTYQTLLECVTLEGVRAHQQAFQDIADANDDEFYPGTRAAGTEGYAESVEYVAGLLEDAGYNVTLDPFEFTFDFPVTIDQLTPVAAELSERRVHRSGFGETTAAVTAVDVNLVPPRANTSGCEAADFAGFVAGNIALIQRGTCTFADKATNAQAAGASAVIIFNQGNARPRRSDRRDTCSVHSDHPGRGRKLRRRRRTRPGGLDCTHRSDRAGDSRGRERHRRAPGGTPTTSSWPARTSTPYDGPGINDNGSGSAAILETALMMAKVKPENTIRFAWWGAEELGLVGSTAYVADQVASAELDDIALYLNYDMVGSPNYVFFVYDGDNSDAAGAPAGPPGSAEIEDVYEAYYTSRGIPFKGTDFSGRSDYGPFIAAGVDIPSGGLFTGAEGIKTAAEARPGAALRVRSTTLLPPRLRHVRAQQEPRWRSTAISSRTHS